MLAAAGAGLIDDAACAAACAARVASTYEPRSEQHDHYQQLFAIYQRLYPSLKEQLAALAVIE